MIKKKSNRRTDKDDDNGFAQWGGYMAAKKSKLENQFLNHAEKEEEQQSDIFKGIAVFVNGYTNPTADQLKHIMMLHGGIYHHYECRSTTHIIASNLPDCKVKQLKTLNVVKPAWIVDSLQAGILLDYKKYLLHSNSTRSQPRLNFPSLNVSESSHVKHSEISTKCSLKEKVEPTFSKSIVLEGELHELNRHMQIPLISSKCKNVSKINQIKDECGPTKSEEVVIWKNKLDAEIGEPKPEPSEDISKCSLPTRPFHVSDIITISCTKSQKNIDPLISTKKFDKNDLESNSNLSPKENVNETPECSQITSEIANTACNFQSDSCEFPPSKKYLDNSPCQCNVNKNEECQKTCTHVCESKEEPLDKSSAVKSKDLSSVLKTTVTSQKNKDQISNHREINSDFKALKFKSPGDLRQSAVDPEFLSEFYGKSRLHHLSTMGALFKEHITKLREQSCGDFPGIKRLCEWKRCQAKPCDVADDEDLMGEDLRDSSVAGMESSESSKSSFKTIMHVDMDCFFVSVGLRTRPELRGMPVAVTHAKKTTSIQREGTDRQFEKDFYNQRFQKRLHKSGGNSPNTEVLKKSRLDLIGKEDSLAEIASCNYAARKAGVKNGMFFGSAVKLCPNLKTIPYDFEGYKEVSYKLYDIVASYTLNVEAVSCDEMYVDCTEVLKKTNISALEFSSFLREEIQTETGCSASAGIGSNPLQARLATKKAKPNGQFHLLPHDVDRFMQEVDIKDLPGIGSSLASRLHSKEIFSCRDLQCLSLSSLQKHFGQKTGQALHRHARGEDNRLLDTCHQRKSVSAEVNYGIRFTLQSEAEDFLRRLSEEVAERLQRARCRGRLLTLKLMVRARGAPVETAKFMGHGACDSISRSTALGVPTNDSKVIFREALALEKHLKIAPNDLRGVGIQMTRLVKVALESNVLTNFLAQKKTAGQKPALKKAGTLFADPECVEKDTNRMDKSNSEKGDKEIGVRWHPSEYAQSKLTNNEGNYCKIELKRIDGQSIPTLMSTESPPIQSRKKNVLCKTQGPNIPVLKDASAVCDASFINEKSLSLIHPPFEVPLMSMAQARNLVRVWVSKDTCPQRGDVLMFVYHMQRLAVSHRLEELDALFSLLHRVLLNRSGQWKDAYQYIFESTQKIMQAVYGSDLKVQQFTN